MNEVYVIRNQDGYYLSKKDEWVDGNDKSVVAFVKFHDQAVNTLVELNSKDFELRGDIKAVELNEKRRPEVVVGEKPLQRDFTLPADETANEETQLDLSADAENTTNA